MLVTLRPELQSQNRVAKCYGKTVGLGAWLTKALWKSNISLCLSQKEKSLAPKLTKWQPFKPQVLKWAWRAQFLSHANQILGKFLSFEDVQMIVKPYFDIFNGIKSAKNQFEQ